ncbi:hypothetical protein [Glaciecola sp. SC05]|uniref:hypothetical protein n=1 Tax=Glaciecola sp. SC05 TaxID=1987355 RepID=UPI003526FDD7
MEIVVKNMKYDAQTWCGFVCVLFLGSVLASDYVMMRPAVPQVLPYAVCGALFIVTFAIYWKNEKALLYLRLVHENNQLMMTDASGRRVIYEVQNCSKANQFGIWLYLTAVDHSGANNDVQRLFIGRWQTNRRSFCSLHRHLNWYVESISGSDKI